MSFETLSVLNKFHGNILGIYYSVYIIIKKLIYVFKKKIISLIRILPNIKKDRCAKNLNIYIWLNFKPISACVNNDISIVVFCFVFLKK